MHIFSNYRAVRSVVMATFNQSRFHFVAHHFLTMNQSELLSLKVGNSLEPVVWRKYLNFINILVIKEYVCIYIYIYTYIFVIVALRKRFNIILGCSLKNIIHL